MKPVFLGAMNNRAILIVDDHAVDIETRSEGRFPSDPMAIIENWDAFCEWARSVELTNEEPQVNAEDMQCPVPRPRAIYGIGLNYRDHAEEAKLDLPKQPMVFAKFPSCIAGPGAEIPLTSNRVDWEAELVVVIGRGGRNIPAEDAMSRIAGYSVGQDISDRRQQFADRPPQFCLGKSAANFGPIGPSVVSTDAFENPNDLAVKCELNGQVVQSSSTANLIFSVSELVEFLSKWCELMPGDLIFTGTPAGVGSLRNPRRYLQDGDVLTTMIDGLGVLKNRCVSATGAT